MYSLKASKAHQDVELALRALWRKVREEWPDNFLDSAGDIRETLREEIVWGGFYDIRKVETLLNYIVLKAGLEDLKHNKKMDCVERDCLKAALEERLDECSGLLIAEGIEFDEDPED